MLERGDWGLLNRFGSKKGLLSNNGLDIRWMPTGVQGLSAISTTALDYAACNANILDPVAVNVTVPSFEVYCSTGEVTINSGVTVTVSPASLWRFS